MKIKILILAGLILTPLASLSQNIKPIAGYVSTSGTPAGPWAAMTGSGGTATGLNPPGAGIYYSTDGSGLPGTWAPCTAACFGGGGGGTITGSGTATHMTLWTGAGAIGDSPATYASSTFTFPGTLAATTIVASQSLSAYGVPMPGTGFNQSTASGSPVVYDLFNWPDGTMLNGKVAQSGNSTWQLSGVDATYGTILGTHLYNAHLGGGGGAIYAHLLNTATNGGTPQPIHTFGATQVFSGTTGVGGALAGETATQDLGNLLHMNYSWTGINLSHKYGPAYYPLAFNAVTAPHNNSDEMAVQMDVSYPAEYATTATWSNGATSINVTSATGIAAGMPVMDGVVKIPWGAVVAASYTPGSTTVPITVATTGIQSSATAVVFGGASVTAYITGALPLVFTDPFIAALGSYTPASWQMIPVGMFVEPSGNTSIDNTVGAVWMGGSQQSKKNLAAGFGASAYDVQTLKGVGASTQYPYQVTIPSAANGGGTGCYRIATHGNLAGSPGALTGDFKITATGFVGQILEFTADSELYGPVYLVEKNNQFNNGDITDVFLSNSGGAVGLDVCTNPASNTSTLYLQILGIGTMTPNLNPTVGATAYTNSQHMGVGTPTNVVTSSSLATTGYSWSTIATGGGTFGGSSIHADFQLLNYFSGFSGQILEFYVDATTSGCSITPKYSSPLSGIGTLRCSWSGSGVQLDINTNVAWTTTTVVTATGVYTLPTTTTAGAVVLSSGNVGYAVVAGANVLYRCLTAGTVLPVGATTINAASCGTSTDTGLRVN